MPTKKVFQPIGQKDKWLCFEVLLKYVALT